MIRELSIWQDDMPRFREDMAREIITVGQRLVTLQLSGSFVRFALLCFL